MIKKAGRLLLYALAVSWIFDFLFWDRTPGISLPIFFLLVLLVLGIKSFEERTPPARQGYWLIFGLLLLIGVTIYRREPMTLFLSVSLWLTLFTTLIVTFRGGHWLNYSFADFFTQFLRLLGGIFVLPAGVFRSSDLSKSNQAESGSRTNWQRLGGFLRGLLLALPIVIIFAALLTAADPVFNNRVEALLEFLNIENLVEYTFRTVYILIFAYLLVGGIAFALLRSQDENLIGIDKPWLPRFLGFTEGAVILGSVNLLFLAFVLVQFQYFFGGQSNITVEGYTYAEYARRGFGELVVVATFSLFLFLALSVITKREQVRERVFSGMGVLLGVLIGVILTSAFQRLLLYESAFGFTRLRTYSHVFMVWLGILVAGFVILEIIGRTRLFAVMTLFAVFGFTATLGIANVDGMIAMQNIARGKLGYELDAAYLLTLSTDATDALITGYSDPSLEEDTRVEIGVVLACQRDKVLRESMELSWPSFHLSRYLANRELSSADLDLSDYVVVQDEFSRPAVQLEDDLFSCDYWGMD